MQAERPLATAVAVEDGNIIAVGDVDSIKANLAKHSLKIDRRFDDKIMMPGLIENHLHPTLAGILFPTEFITPYDWQLPGRNIKGVQGRDSYLQRLTQAEAAITDPTEMLISWGYHQYFHGQLTRADIDRISDSRPIIVWQRSFHEIIVNTPALEALGITAEEFAGHPAIDFNDGHFWELGLFAIFPRLAPIVLNPARFNKGVLDGFLHAQMNGITTVADQGSPLFDLEMELNSINSVLHENELPLRMFMVGNGKTLATESYQAALQILDALPQRNSAHVQFLPKQVKLLADGAFYSQLMQMEGGYLDGHEGEWIMPPEDLKAAAQVYWPAGYQLHIHVNGDKGLNEVLKLVENLQAEFPRTDHQTVLHHYGYSGADHAERIAALGISVSANPFYLWALGDKYSETGLGPDRAHYITRLGDLERNGVSVSFHSDLPMAPASPLALAGIAASRITAQGNLLAADERMSVDAALRGITIEAARAIQLQEKIGSIEAGKLADFTILEQDPYLTEPENFKNIGISATVVGGKVYASPE
ncbi:MAG: amidohydrolase [Arenicella sp.]|nr:amidohydrolase [Arenicella sp.]